jgi:hypothetical protein
VAGRHPALPLADSLAESWCWAARSRVQEAVSESLPSRLSYFALKNPWHG